MSQYAAFDIGSNSVRMQAAQVLAGRTARILAEDRQVTRLGQSVFREGIISPEAMEQTCEALARMARSLETFDLSAVRAVATCAVRDAGNQEEFLDRAGRAIGAPVEVISGQEEARLIHLGVQSRWPHPKQDILIVDIGGGSAELIQSLRGRLSESFSKPLGAVRLTEVFLKHDPPTAVELRQLEEYIQEKLEPALRRIGKDRHDRAVATSATAAAVVCSLRHVPRSKRGLVDRLRVSRTELTGLFEDLSRKSVEQRRKVPGIGPRRAEVIVAGCAVLAKILEAFRLPSLYYSAAGVRDGIVADLSLRGVEREEARLDEEQRRTVRELARRYGVPLRHADKVAAMARHLFESLRPLHQLPAPWARLLEAAAYLHDTGHFISSTRHHKHSYYVVSNSDLPGFTDRERLVVANLCRYHRKALPAAHHDNYKALKTEEQNRVLSMIPLLRLADSLDVSREQRVKHVAVRIHNGRVELYLESRQDVDLEQWAAQRNSEVFEQVYGSALKVMKSGSS